jgi:hypothetical protein
MVAIYHKKQIISMLDAVEKSRNTNDPLINELRDVFNNAPSVCYCEPKETLKPLQRRFQTILTRLGMI